MKVTVLLTDEGTRTLGSGEQEVTFDNVVAPPEYLPNGSMRLITQSSPLEFIIIADGQWASVRHGAFSKEGLAY